MVILVCACLVNMVGCSGRNHSSSEDGEADTVNDLDLDTSLDPDVEPDTEPDTELDADAEPDTELDAEPDAELDAEPDSELDAEPDTLGFVPITPGSFTMGSPTSEPGRKTDETEHTVTMTRRFEIMETEVTQAQFNALVGYNPSSFTSCGIDCPVESVNWHEAAAYANAMSLSAGLSECYTCTGSGSGVWCVPSTSYSTPYDCPGYRLPTEAEWEYSARAGTTGGTYNGTSTLTDCTMPNTVVDPIAWFCGNSSTTTHTVLGKTPNAWGLHDMLGNVWEWCSDWYDTYPGTVMDPWGPGTGLYRVARGGSWFDDAGNVRAALRSLCPLDFRCSCTGFRLARSLP